MKKPDIIMLALVFVLSIAGTALAANPFIDVPANHWAYGAVAKLATAGIVDGMGDGTYQGDRNMTRYEMAQIVAKAMAKADKANAANKALIEKLEAEFAAELNNLGVRVSKLEAKAGSVAFYGDAEVLWGKYQGSNDSITSMRLKLAMEADINDNTQFFGRIMAMNYNEFGTTERDRSQIVDAAFTTTGLFGSNVDATVGRFSQKVLQTGYLADSVGMMDGVKVMFGDKLSTTLGYAEYSDILSGTEISSLRYAHVDYDLSKATNIKALYAKDQGKYLVDVWGVGVESKLNKDWTLIADYSRNRAFNDSPKLFVGRLAYKGLDLQQVGSWGAHLEYRRAEYGSCWQGISGADIPVDETKGWNIYYGRTLAKNMILETYFGFAEKWSDDNSNAPDYTRVQLKFFF